MFEISASSLVEFKCDQLLHYSSRRLNILKPSRRRNTQVGITEEKDSCHRGKSAVAAALFTGRDETFHYFLQLVSAHVAI